MQPVMETWDVKPPQGQFIAGVVIWSDLTQLFSIFVFQPFSNTYEGEEVQWLFAIPQIHVAKNVMEILYSYAL